MKPLYERKVEALSQSKLKKPLKRISRITGIVLAFVLILVLLMVADYLNIPSHLGISVVNCNLELQSIIISNGLVILLFLLAYLLLDKRNIEKEKNKRNIALVHLKNVYMHCQTLVELFSDYEFLPIVASHNANPYDIHDPFLSHYRALPFVESNETIVAFAQEGVLNSDEIDKYIEIKWKLGSYIDKMVMLYRINKKAIMKSEKERLHSNLNNVLSAIESELNTNQDNQCECSKNIYRGAY